MNKTLLLVLVTIVQSQSDGTLLSTNPILSDSIDDNHNGIYLEDLEDLEYPRAQLLSDDIDEEKLPIVRKRSAVDPLTRRSALDKNFMRFGRSGFFPDDNTSKTKNLMRFSDSDGLALAARSPNSNFVRFGRGVQDNFLRFGKGQKDNFIRFGRGAKDNFIRFGRGPNDNFMRFGKGAKDNFIRFGKPDKNFMRFGRNFDDDDIDEDDVFYRLAKSNSNFLRFGKSPKSLTSFVRFGKSPKKENFIRFGRSSGHKENRNNTNFLRFGRDDVNGGKDPSEVDEVTDSDVDLGDLDLNGDKLKNGPIIRIKRKAKNEESGQNDHLNNHKRDAEIMEEIPKLKYDDPTPGDDDVRHHNVNKRSTDNFEKISKPENVLKSLSQILFEGDSSRPLRLYSDLPSGYQNVIWTPEFSILPHESESKRNQGGSNFIRFG